MSPQGGLESEQVSHATTGPHSAVGLLRPRAPNGGCRRVAPPANVQVRGIRDRIRDRKGVEARPVAVERDRELSNSRHPIRAGRTYLRKFYLGCWHRHHSPGTDTQTGQRKAGVRLWLWAGVAVPTPSTRSRVPETPSPSRRVPYPIRTEHDPPKGGYATAMGWIRDRVPGHLRYV